MCEQEVYLDKIARLNPANAEEQCKLALTYLEVGDSDKALAKFKDALDETPYDVNTIFPRGGHGDQQRQAGRGCGT